MIPGVITKLLKNKKASKFLYYNLVSILGFALLYWISDFFMSLYPELAEKLFLGKNEGPPDPFQYYIWFSLITQTTVGYAGLLRADGSRENFILVKSLPFKLFNMLQLFSIILIPALLLI